MKSRWKIWLVVLILAGIGISCLLLSTPKEPKYNGKTASEWFSELDDKKGIEANDQALAAIKSMGNEAVPFLMHELRSSNSRVHHSLFERMNRLRHGVLTSDDVLGGRVIMCLEYLGPQAEPAIPELIEMAKDPGARYRYSAVDLLGKTHLHPEQTIPVLVELVNGKDDGIRTQAVLALRNFGPAAKPAVPALITYWQSSTNPAVRLNVAIAIKLIDPAAAAKEGIK